ncbi:retinitis pigmentosa 9 protein isoform X5 [Scyliorhinus torazame]|uniref:retinitis pigmentosa 9 protein isoform X5 n=1 Tax=Scyliorhinus torazame TaxID=75743 RepID=UPI003B5A29F9
MAEDSRASGNERRHHRRKRHTAEEKEPERKKKKRLHQEVKKIKHVETFYEKPPPGMIKEDDDKPEDCIPDLPGNEGARDFLAHAPTKGLWMPLGKEVKVMQCWRCKNFGHRTGDRECPYFISGNQKLEQFRVGALSERCFSMINRLGLYSSGGPVVTTIAPGKDARPCRCYNNR